MLKLIVIDFSTYIIPPDDIPNAQLKNLSRQQCELAALTFLMKNLDICFNVRGNLHEI
jgi:hypothetical protein